MKHWRKTLLATAMILVLIATLLTGCGSPAGSEGDDTAEPAEKTIVYAVGSAWSRLMPYDLVGMFSIMPNEK